jgi:hypothetical protein
MFLGSGLTQEQDESLQKATRHGGQAATNEVLGDLT